MYDCGRLVVSMLGWIGQSVPDQAWNLFVCTVLSLKTHAEKNDRLLPF